MDRKWGISYCALFFKDNGQFLTITEFKARFGLKVDFLTFNGCISSMKQYIKKLNIVVINNNASDMNVALILKS